ncbi:MAG: 2Fe-2S iron-sulfur cluster binding domain-containing protein [Acidimicrobiia bacterium]|nr:2Fe-2S iron-sulfur cluster binding domain-containing protein [Acidimicrobiia bacterium]
MMVTEIDATVNGTRWRGEVESGASLLDVIRGQMGLTGTKRGCEWLACGVCTVLLNGRPVSSCGTMATDIDGQTLVTIEGLDRSTPEFSELQKAFVEKVAFQCGYCTSGQLVLAEALRIAQGDDTHEPNVREWMSTNLCRCGSYVGICSAVESYLERTTEPATTTE